MRLIAVALVALTAGCFKDERTAEAFREACLKKGGVVVTNTRTQRGDPRYVCVRPL